MLISIHLLDNCCNFYDERVYFWGEREGLGVKIYVRCTELEVLRVTESLPRG